MADKLRGVYIDGCKQESHECFVRLLRLNYLSPHNVCHYYLGFYRGHLIHVDGGSGRQRLQHAHELRAGSCRVFEARPAVHAMETASVQSLACRCCGAGVTGYGSALEALHLGPNPSYVKVGHSCSIERLTTLPGFHPVLYERRIWAFECM